MSASKTTPDQHPAATQPGAVTGLIALGASLTALLDRLTRREGGLSLMQYRALDLVGQVAPDPLEPGELAEALQTGSNHVTALLDSLESQGLVSRQPHPHDGRRRLITATASGIARAQMLTPHLVALEARLLETALVPDDRRRLGEYAQAVQAVLDGLVIPPQRMRPGP